MYQCREAHFDYLPNPRIPGLKMKYSCIRRVVFSDEAATAEKLPENVILGAADIQRIKSTEPAVLGSNPNTELRPSSLH